MDVHPPLAKLLITLAGWLAGFDGNFDFKDIGKDYLEPGVPYVAMRMLPAILGVLTIPLMFLTLKASGCRTITAVLGAGVVIFGKPFPVDRDPFQTSRVRILTALRKWSHHPVPFDPFGLPPGLLHGSHRVGVHLFHQPARTGSFSCVPRALVVLVGLYGSVLGCHPECQVGWTLHCRVGGQPHHRPVVGASRRPADRHTGMCYPVVCRGSKD